MKTYSKKKLPFFQTITPYLLLFICLVLIVCFLPSWLIKPTLLRSAFDEDTGVIGDTIGGIMAPFIAIIAALLTFIAFWVQFQANRKQREDIELERFENKFYELIRLHRANVEEMNIADKVKARKVFVKMFYEFKFVYLSFFTIHRAHKNKLISKAYRQTELANIAFKTFFYGIGNESNKIINYLIREDDLPLVELVREYLSIWQGEYIEQSMKSIGGYGLLSLFTQDGVYTFEPNYFPFDGHASRLGHYYRHLYQTVTYVVDQPTGFLNRDQKLNYLKTLRAQLSDHEQLLLFYDGISDFGKAWVDKKLFTNYKMIKNIPLALTLDFYLTPILFLGERNDYDELIFEWNE